MKNDNKELKLIEDEMKRCVVNLNKICIINTTFPPFPPNIPHIRTAIELGVANIAKGLKQKYDVFTISKHFISKDESFDDTEWNGIKVYRIGEYHPYMQEKSEFVNGLRFISNELFNLVTFYKFVKFFKQEKPDAVFVGDTRQISLAPLIAAKLLRIPFFIRYDSLCPLYPKEHLCSMRDRIAGCGECIEKIILVKLDKLTKIGVGMLSTLVYKLKVPLWNSSAGVFALNKFYENLYQEYGLKPDKIKIVSTAHILPTPSSFKYYIDLNSEHKENGCKYVLYAGRLSPEKGVEILLDSFEILSNKHKHIKLLIAGEGILKNKVEEKARSQKNMRFLGWQNDEQLAELYSIVDVVVIPSIVPEGHPRVAEEAMQFKRPIVGFPLGGLEEILEKYSLGMPVSEKTPQSLATAIENTLQLAS